MGSMAATVVSLQGLLGQLQQLQELLDVTSANGIVATSRQGAHLAANVLQASDDVHLLLEHLEDDVQQLSLRLHGCAKQAQHLLRQSLNNDRHDNGGEAAGPDSMPTAAAIAELEQELQGIRAQLLAGLEAARDKGCKDVWACVRSAILCSRFPTE